MIFKTRTKKVPFYEFFGDTIQGEGPRLKSAVFVRVAGCNNTCKGFGCSAVAPDGSVVTGCDTIRAVSPKFKSQWKYFDNFKDLTSIIDSLVAFKTPEIKHTKDIILTGGEPLLYWDTNVIQDFLAYYISRKHQITIETNASLDIEFFKEYQKEIMFSMSVKLSCSGEPKKKRINIKTISKILENCPKSYLKFVVNPETWDTDYTEIKEILYDLPTYAEVYLMPMGETRELQIKNTPFVFEKCAEHGFSFSPRAHILAFDTKEGI